MRDENERRMMHYDKDNFREMKPNYWIAATAAENIKAEAEAIEKYERFLSQLDPISDARTINIVEEILSDEKNHLIKLQHILKCYDMVNANKDGLPSKHKKVADDIFSKKG